MPKKQTHPYAAVAVALCDTVQARAHRLCPVAVQPHVALVCRLMVSTPLFHAIKWITTLLPTPNGWKAESACLVEWPTADNLPTKWPPSCQPWIRRTAGKFWRPKTDLLTIELRRQLFTIRINTGMGVVSVHISDPKLNGVRQRRYTRSFAPFGHGRSHILVMVDTNIKQEQSEGGNYFFRVIILA